MKLTKKQMKVIQRVRVEDPKIIFLYGAKRAGKTFLAILMFLSHVAKYQNKGLSFIIGGVNYSSIERNILNEMEDLLKTEIRLDKSGSFKLFGNTVYVFDGALSTSWKKVRGFTSAGALINEATALHDTFIKEVISRCSYPGARVIGDTNPENPSHSVKKDYIDKSGQKLSSGRTNILAFHFSLYDNEMLDAEYVESIVAATPSGAFMDRDIHGRWVAREGAVYTDYNKNQANISRVLLDEIQFDRIVVGVDWGYEHYGTMVVVGVLGEQYYLLEEHAHRFRDIDYWSMKAEEIELRYRAEFGKVRFYCDSARPEYVARLQNDGRNAMGANKSILPGVSKVAQLFKQNHIRLVVEEFPRFEEEVNNYVWDTRSDKPKSESDDVLDAIRYAIMSDFVVRNQEDDDSQYEALRKLGLA